MTKQRFKKLLVVALKAEWNHLNQQFKIAQDSQHKSLYRFVDDPSVGLVQVGFGPHHSGQNFQEALRYCSCERVLHFGSCGGLEPYMKVGDIFLSQVIVSTLGPHPIQIQSSYWHALSKFLDGAQISYTAGKLLSSIDVLKNLQEKKAAQKEFGVSAVDMESYTIAKICDEQDIDYLGVRAVFDQLEDDLEAIGEPYDPQGNLKASQLAVNLIKNPKLILQVPALKKRADLVNQSLSKVISWYLNH